MDKFLRVSKRLAFNCLFALKWCFESFIRVVGPVFVVLALTLISGVIYVHFVNSIPFYGPYTSLGNLLHLIMSVYISFCIGYNYLCAVLVPPGSPPSSEELGLTSTQLSALQNDEIDQKGYVPHEYRRFCKRCNRPKPERTHHCHVCGRCVLKMDHHCPWVANCVGHRNHHYFVLFIFWLWLGCGYAASMSFIPFTLTSNTALPFRGSVSRGAVIFSFVIALSVCIALSLMLAWQIYLVFSAQTTIEFYFNRTAISDAKKVGRAYINPFDLGVAGNFQTFFGTRDGKFWFSWLFPGGVKVVGDGITYPKRYAELPL